MFQERQPIYTLELTQTTLLPLQVLLMHQNKEACSGSIADLAHVVTADCLADCLTKASANSRCVPLS